MDEPRPEAAIPTSGFLREAPPEGCSSTIQGGEMTIWIHASTRSVRHLTVGLCVLLVICSLFTFLGVSFLSRASGRAGTVFVVAWVSVWTILWLACGLLLCWRLFGRTILTIGPDSMHVEKTVLGMSRTWSASRHQIQQIIQSKHNVQVGKGY